MAWIGADLAAMDGLARRFVTTSEACQSHAETVVATATHTAAQFTEAMTTLEREAVGLDADIAASVRALRAQAEATTWTGANRTRQDEILTAYQDDVDGVRAAIEAFLADAATIVRGALTPTVEALRDDVQAAGSNAIAVADGFALNVARQRSAFDAVMNGAR